MYGNSSGPSVTGYPIDRELLRQQRERHQVRLARRAQQRAEQTPASRRVDR